MKRVVVVGASLAGMTAADTLRAEGFDGEIVVVGDEVHAAYARPPLSKGVLAGREDPASVALPPAGDDLDIRRGRRAVGVDLTDRRVQLGDGAQLGYDGLVVATGSRARRLPDAGTPGQFVLRTFDDCLLLREQLRHSRDVLIAGGGFLGLEIASTCRELGLAVTVVDREPPLRRILGGPLADLVVAAARDAGVEVVVAPGDAELIVEDRVRGLRAADGRNWRADLVISAIGDVPNVGWLAGTSLAPGGAVTVDAAGRTAAAGVVAAGDVCAVDGAAARTPHWQSAIVQARTAARTLLGLGPGDPAAEVPYFWTEGFGLEVKLCGAPTPEATVTVLDGSIADRSAVLQWHADGVPVAAAAVNRRMPLPRLKRLARPAAQEAITS